MRMKNIGLASVMCMLCALPSYADIASGASSATCDNSTIGATSGSTGLEAEWNANSITVNWYNGNTKITTNTCSYDGAVTIPATPTKAGYTFNGWHIRVEPLCYEITDQTACLASSKGCSWSKYSGCYFACSSLATESACNANLECAYAYHPCGTDGCQAFGGNDPTIIDEDVRCDTLTTQQDCEGKYWYDGYHPCEWANNRCIYSISVGDCVG